MKTILIACCNSFSVMIFCLVVVFAGGYFAGSLAVMTDAAHLLVDFTSFIISLCSLWLSSRPATHTLNYGWHRAGKSVSIILFLLLIMALFNTWIFCVFSEILGALLSVFTIWLVTGVLVYLAVERLISDDFEIEGTVMLITSGCAVIANIMYVCFFVLLNFKP